MTISRNLSILADGASSAGVLDVASGGTAVTTSTGTGSVVLNTSPTLITPALGTPSSGTLTNCTFPTLNQNTTGTASNVTGTVAVANGGTGQTTYTNGQLLIGNTTGNTLTKATLTAGTAISVTNGTGSISIANTGVTSIVAGTGISISGGTGAVTVTNSSSVNSTQIARAWVRYNGDAQTVTDSYNVSSVTYNGTGDYTINFSTALNNANYALGGSAQSSGDAPASMGISSSSTTTCNIRLSQHNVGARNRSNTCAVFFST